MTKTIDATFEIVRAPKHQFHNTESQPGKARQRRYERRKVKECIKVQNWQDQEE